MFKFFRSVLYFGSCVKPSLVAINWILNRGSFSKKNNKGFAKYKNSSILFTGQVRKDF